MTFRTKSRAWVCALTVLMLLLAPTGRAFADGGGHGLEKEVAGYHVQLVIEGKAVTGENEVAVKLFDAQEQPVSGAEVKVYAELADAHAANEDGDEHAESTAGSADHAEAEAGDEHADAEAEDDHAEEAQPAATPEPAMSGMSGMQPEAPQATEPPADPHVEPEAETGEVHDEMEDNASEEAHSQAAMDNIIFEAGETPGEYHGTLDFARAGNWTITVHFATPDTNAEVHFELEVNSRVNRTFLLGGFAGINASVIAAAAILKRRSAITARQLRQG